MEKIRFGMIGSGWRAEFFIRIAKALPDIFELSAVMIRDKEKGMKYAKEFDINVVQTIEEVEQTKVDFIVISVNRTVTMDYLQKLFKMGIPVLCETPPADSIEKLDKLWELYKQHNAKIQVAEQYFAQPLYAAWLKAIEDGMIGEIQNINISSLHAYHGVSIISRVLGCEFVNCTISGKKFWFEATETYGRDGMVFDGEVKKFPRDRVTLEFENGKVAFFDFAGVQYHSFIRTRQLNIQGTRGEIDDMTIRYITKDGNIPVTQELRRIDFGAYNNQEWAHYGIMLGEKFLYKSPFKFPRLNDDEIAIATCMYKMKDYINKGIEFYPLKDALQDTYIGFKIDEAVQENKPIKTTTQIWNQ
ncbi:dehydrogenase [Candidatus Epulonipiscium fishelsonii]|uniref:Dehydrogenase n=2 Tax=Candidatus Epulonipiscium fishelsonii TaxID=77094 RepID=A0ACC8XCA9_9FIRM|nr:dehydrogenase [Epulopiscium sp. SCG-B11WGA-EpuloA1]ONI41601.1 dehydrogenase [Epulopiscium sp. SCG-B11WGA-EpuloA1]ONI43913.1 dehydrogenase [Epulopiscium sp. SCG-B05WGA-EpuloA1]